VSSAVPLPYPCVAANSCNSLRRYHFYPKPRGRPKSDEPSRRRAGSAGGNEPNIAVLKKYWLRAVEVHNQLGGASDDGDADEEEEELEQQRQRDGRDRVMRWGLGEGAARGDGGEGAAGEEAEGPYAFISMQDRARMRVGLAPRYDGDDLD
jgi:hypothetical protein